MAVRRRGLIRIAVLVWYLLAMIFPGCAQSKAVKAPPPTIDLTPSSDEALLRLPHRSCHGGGHRPVCGALPQLSRCAEDPVTQAPRAEIEKTDRLLKQSDGQQISGEGKRAL